MTKFHRGESASPAIILLDDIFREYLNLKASLIKITLGEARGCVHFDGQSMIELPLPVSAAMFMAMKALIGYDPQRYPIDIEGCFEYECDGKGHNLNAWISDSQRIMEIERS
jgi:hypothetical protein